MENNSNNKGTLIGIVIGVIVFLGLGIYALISLNDTFSFLSPYNSIGTQYIQDDDIPVSDGDVVSDEFDYEENIYKIELIEAKSVNSFLVSVVDENGNKSEPKMIHAIGVGDEGSVKDGLIILSYGLAAKNYTGEDDDISEIAKNTSTEQLLEYAKQNKDLYIEIEDKTANEINSYIWMGEPEATGSRCYNYDVVNDDGAPLVKEEVAEDRINSFEYKLDEGEPIRLHKARVKSVIDESSVMIVTLEDEIDEDEDVEYFEDLGLKFNMDVIRIKELEDEEFEKISSEYVSNHFHTGDSVYVEIWWTGSLYTCNIWDSPNVSRTYEDYINHCFTAKMIKELNVESKYINGARDELYLRRIYEGY